MSVLDTTKHCPLCEDAGRRIDALTIERNDALAAAQLLKEQNEALVQDQERSKLMRVLK